MRLTFACLPLLTLLLAAPALAQYKVVGPDGRVTYTDRPPATGSSTVVEMGRRNAATESPSGPALPAELERLSQRFPVTLFSASNCAPCDAGRALLADRGIPYTERLVISNEDVAALERTVGARTLPALTVGGQALAGYSPADWSSYIDAAGYPQTSQLPQGWKPPAPTPLVARLPASPRSAAAAPPAPEDSPTPAPTPAPPGNTLRF